MKEETWEKKSTGAKIEEIGKKNHKLQHTFKTFAQVRSMLLNSEKPIVGFGTLEVLHIFI